MPEFVLNKRRAAASNSPFMNPKLILLALVSLSATGLMAAEKPAAIQPLGANGQPLNLGFESGTLQNWTATGDAFTKQPVKGDTVSARRGDMKSGHQGQYWVGSFEATGDDAMGTLTSVPFKVTQPWASFLVAGGTSDKTRVEVVLKEGVNEKVIFKSSGTEVEDLKRAVVDLQPQQGKDIFIRVVDEAKGAWNHINFDDFVFHAARPEFPAAQRAKVVVALPADDVKFSGLSAEQAAKEITLPPGFKATLFAGEPDIVQPIAFCIDDRGRLWVVEGMTYPKRQPEGQGKDRILVLEDSNGDGKFDKRTVFLEKQNLVSGIEIGFGGVWIGAAPYLMFVPVKDWDNPKPAGEAQILLDGWDYARDTHETLNTFKWGPDGWLYGCHGVFCPSNVGKPGTPKEQRQWVDAAVWRYHPTKHQFEVFSEGTSNPWGVDFDENGQCFIEACVIPHLFHMIQGGRYQRQGGAHYAANADETQRFAANKEGKSDKTLNPFIYDDIKTIADHRHYLGDKGPHAANGRSDAAGGGHAHAGLLVYQGDSFPAEYRGKLFMNNIHGQRINMDIVERSGSGFVGKHGADFANFNDRWSQVIDLRSGPDGSVFMIDWYDKNQCHHNDVNGHDRSNGRIFKVSYGEKLSMKANMTTGSDSALLQSQMHLNDWRARQARKLLQERVANNSIKESQSATVRAWLGLEKGQGKLSADNYHRSSDDTVSQVRLLWTAHILNALSDKERLKLIQRPEAIIRAWTIQLACEDKKPSDTLLKEFARMAREDKSPVVRLYLASALQRLPIAQRVEILEGLLAHAEDAQDQNLPLMYWYAAEPVVAQGTISAAKLLAKTKIPQVREYITRRMTAGAK